MREAEWLTCADPEPLLRWLRNRPSDRKLRLFAVACCRRLWDQITDDRVRKAIEAAEQHAEGQLPAEHHGPAVGEVFRAWKDSGEDGQRPSRVGHHLAGAGHDTICTYRDHILRACRETQAAARLSLPGGESEAAIQAALLRDILGNPFRPVILDPDWRTSTVLALAREMYESRDFSAIPILADALQDAGCEIAQILEHCRGPGPHARGCFVVDLVLGKEPQTEPGAEPNPAA